MSKALLLFFLIRWSRSCRCASSALTAAIRSLKDLGRSSLWELATEEARPAACETGRCKKGPNFLSSASSLLRRLGALFSDISRPVNPLSIPSRTLCGDLCGSIGWARRTGDTGTCISACDFDLSNRSSRSPAILDCARLAATEFDLARGAEALPSFSVSELCFDFFCSFLSFNRACISCNCNCRVSSSSSESSPPI